MRTTYAGALMLAAPFAAAAATGLVVGAAAALLSDATRLLGRLTR